MQGLLFTFLVIGAFHNVPHDVNSTNVMELGADPANCKLICALLSSSLINTTLLLVTLEVTTEKGLFSPLEHGGDHHQQRHPYLSLY